MTARPAQSLPPAYFEALYEADLDPWHFTDSLYEREKYAHTLSALERPSYGSAFEAGCAIGVLTHLLAPRCRHLLAVDASRRALAAAAERCTGDANVRLDCLWLPAEWPRERFDLILLSEICYYWSRDDLARSAALTAGSLAPGGEVVLVHWTGETDYPLSGDEAAELFLSLVPPGLQLVRQERLPAYRLDLLRAG